MAEPKEDAFLDDPEMMEEEFDLDAAMEEEPEAAPKSGRATVEAIVAERDEIRAYWNSASVNRPPATRSRPNNTAPPVWHGTCCRSTTICVAHWMPPEKRRMV